MYTGVNGKYDLLVGFSEPANGPSVYETAIKGGSTMNNRGFTLIELLVCIAILVILIVGAAGYFTDPAHGGQKAFVLMKVNSENIDFAVNTMGQSPGLKIQVMVYISKWTHENMDAHIDKAELVYDQLIAKGVSNDSVVMLFANKKGLEMHKGPLATPTPAEDGVYLVLTYY